MTNKLIVTNALFVVLVGAHHQTATAQNKGGITKRVALTKTKPCVILTGTVQPVNFDTYVFTARKNQTIIAEPFYYGEEIDRPAADEQGSSDFDLIAPDGAKSSDPQDVIFTGGRTGEYKIRVRPSDRRTDAKYVLKISVTDRTPMDSGAFGKPPVCP